MPRQNRSIEGLIGGPCKVRKRVCSPSLSSSSLVQNYRFKRAILVGKRGGSITPVPRSPSSMVGISESPKYPPSQNGIKGKQPPISARKLGATLWEMNEIPSPRMKEELQDRRTKKETKGKGRISRSVQSSSLAPHLSDPSHSPVSERMDRSVIGSPRRSSSGISQRVRLTDHNVGGLGILSNASLMEIETRSRELTPTASVVGGVKTRLKDLRSGLTTSKELLKLLNRLWGHEEQHTSSMSLISALGVELDRARLQVDQLTHEQRSDRNEINYLMKHFAEEKAAWKSKEHERIQGAIDSIVGDLEVERKLRRRAESLNKKLGRELAETKASLLSVVKELESKKTTREVMEQVCDELVRGIGEDKSEVEELKGESVKVLGEVEEKEMPQLVDVLHEERVHMKLSEAKYQFDEKNAAEDKLRSKLEAFLRTRRAKENQVVSENHGNKVEIGSHLSNTHLGFYQNEEREVEDGEEQEEDSAESDLHSIEFKMDNNSKSYRRSYAGAIQENPKRFSVEEEIKGRKSVSEKISRGSISLERGISDGIKWDLTTENSQNSRDRLDRGRLFELEKQAPIQDYKVETQRYKSVRSLRDHLLSGSRMASAQGFASPTRQSGLPRPMRDTSNAASKRLTVVQESGLKERLVHAKGGEGQNSRCSR